MWIYLKNNWVLFILKTSGSRGSTCIWVFMLLYVTLCYFTRSIASVREGGMKTEERSSDDTENSKSSEEEFQMMPTRTDLKIKQRIDFMYNL